MQTRLSNYSVSYPRFSGKWQNYFHAGTDWLISLQILVDQRDETHGGIFSVEPTIVALCLELFVKALAAQEDPDFKGHKFKHRTLDILRAYGERVPIFKEILGEEELLSIFAEYGREAIGLRYGEVGGSFPSNEKQRLIDLAYSLRAEISRRTGLR